MRPEAAISEALEAAFGHNTPAYNRYRAAAELDHGPNFVRSAPAFGRGPGIDYDARDAQDARRYFAEGKAQSIVLLRQAISALEDQIADQEPSRSTAPTVGEPFPPVMEVKVATLPSESKYMSAEVCLNGHSTTGGIEYSSELTAKFCATCGAETIRTCRSCTATIRGDYYVPGFLSTAEYTPPNHCYNCGAAFPWKIAKVEAAKEQVADIEELDANEKEQLQSAIDDLAAGGARTELAAGRFKRLMKKAGQSVGGGLYKIVVDVASEAAKKALMGL